MTKRAILTLRAVEFAHFLPFHVGILLYYHLADSLSVVDHIILFTEVD